MASSALCLCSVVLCVYVLQCVNPQALPIDETPENCHSNGKNYKVGATWVDPGECERNTCLEGGLIKTETCPELPPPSKAPGCRKVPVDLSKPFPDCCPKYVCSPSPSTSS